MPAAVVTNNNDDHRKQTYDTISYLHWKAASLI